MVKEKKQKRDRLREVQITKIAKQKQIFELNNITEIKEMVFKREEKLLGDEK